MSFHLPYRGLSQELRDMIYKHALCPPQGLTIKTLRNESGDPTFKCVQPITSALLRTNRQVYDVTLPLLYNGNVFSLDMDCPDALDFLQILPEKKRDLIRNLDLPKYLMAADDYGNRDRAEELGQFVLDNLRLDSVTLAVPNDLEAGTDKGTGEYEWFMWTLHQALIKAFKEGRFQEIRFAHPKPCAENVSVYGFHNVQRYIEDVLLEEHKQSLSERRTNYWDCYYDARGDGTVCRDTLDAVHKFSGDIWRRAGYTIERDISRPGEKGTVVVIRRISASIKRGHDGVGSSSERKRSRGIRK